MLTKVEITLQGKLGGKEMKIEDGSNFFQFEVTEQVPPDVQGTGDTRFELEVHLSAPRGNDFHGKSWAWIDANALSIFAEQLLQIHQGKSDSASVIAMSPNEFTSRFVSTTRRSISGYSANSDIGAIVVLRDRTGQKSTSESTSPRMN